MRLAAASRIRRRPGRALHLGLIGTNPADFAMVLPDAEARLLADLGRWVSPGNFALHPKVRRAVTAGPSAAVREKLAELRRRYDPDRLFG